jgi:hypothetical protein
MSANSDTGVCDKFGRTWDVPNLFVMDGSVFRPGDRHHRSRQELLDAGCIEVYQDIAELLERLTKAPLCTTALRNAGCPFMQSDLISGHSRGNTNCFPASFVIADDGLEGAKYGIDKDHPKLGTNTVKSLNQLATGCK